MIVLPRRRPTFKIALQLEFAELLCRNIEIQELGNVE
jgi:hypothetical protein